MTTLTVIIITALSSAALPTFLWWRAMNQRDAHARARRAAIERATTAEQQVAVALDEVAAAWEAAGLPADALPATLGGRLDALLGDVRHRTEMARLRLHDAVGAEMQARTLRTDLREAERRIGYLAAELDDARRRGYAPAPKGPDALGITFAGDPIGQDR